MPGQYADATALYHNGARDYLPNFALAGGRYAEVDPIGLMGGLNPYVYAGNNPYKNIDPLGLIDGLAWWEGDIPIYGSTATAMYDYYCGAWGSSILNLVGAGSDAFLAKSFAGAVSKGLWHFGGHSWTNARGWLRDHNWIEPGDEGHHWAIPQNGWGGYFPNWLKNQPWNIMSVDKAVHMDIHYAMNQAEVFWNGTPTWFKAGIADIGAKISNGFKGDCGKCQ